MSWIFAPYGFTFNSVLSRTDAPVTVQEQKAKTDQQDAARTLWLNENIAVGMIKGYYDHKTYLAIGYMNVQGYNVFYRSREPVAEWYKWWTPERIRAYDIFMRSAA